MQSYTGNGETCEYSANNAFRYNTSNGNVNNTSKYNNNYVRAVSDFQNDNTAAFCGFLETMEDAEGLCFVNKASTPEAVRFLLDESVNLYALALDIWRGEYVPLPSTAFVLSYPVRREVIAARFRDRIVQHWVMARLAPLMERLAFDPNQFSCRVGKGSLAALNALRDEMARDSNRYASEAYVAKWDMSAFFYSIDKRRLYDELITLVVAHYEGDYKDILLYLIRVLTFSLPQEHMIRRCPASEWEGLERKSLLNVDWFLGMAIGNLPAQWDANFFNAPVMRWLRSVGLVPVNYVDDFAAVFKTKEDYRMTMPLLTDFCKRERGLTVHPNKHYFQPCGHGVKMLGGVVKYERLYVSNRTVAKFENRIHWHNETFAGRPAARLRRLEGFVAMVNSYLGLMGHFASYNIRKREAGEISKVWGDMLYFPPDFSKAVIRPEYDRRRKIRQRVRAQKRGDLKYMYN